MSRKWLAWLDFFISLHHYFSSLFFENSRKWVERYPPCGDVTKIVQSGGAPTIVVNMEWNKPPKKIAKLLISGFSWCYFTPKIKVEFWAPTSRSWFFWAGPPWAGPGRRSRLLKERFLRFWLQKTPLSKDERDDSKHHLLTSSCGVNIYCYMGFYWDFDMVKLVASRVEKYGDRMDLIISWANLLLVFLVGSF